MTFSECLALPALTGIRSDRVTDAQSASVRALCVASALERGEDPETAASASGRMFRRTIAEECRTALRSLSERGLMAEGEDLSALEIANTGARCWKARGDALRSVMEPLGRALGDGSLSREQMCLLWLLREAGCLPFVLPPAELRAAEGSEALRAFPPWRIMFGRKLELGNVKRRPGDIPLAEDRAAPVFVEGIFLSGGDRAGALMELLSERGHDAEMMDGDEEVLMMIDGICCRAELHARRAGRLPSEGVSLRPACSEE